MGHALALGRRGLGRVWPNPAVGCVLMAGGRVVGRGWTRPGGRPHAETVALAQAGPAARGATAYVTLEPCAHHGRTPPCADALIAAGVARVVTALTDPDPRVAGRGHGRLRAAGVAVDQDVCAAAAARDHAGFLSRVAAGRPLLTLKLAMSVDGRIATATGESQWITGPAARRRVHLMRLTHDAVLVGAGTARADDPSLTVRGFGDVAQPVRVVAARTLDVDPRGTLGRTAGEAPVWLCHGSDAPAARLVEWQATGARCLEVASGPTGLAAPALLARLGAEGLTRVFCEGGGQFAASLLAADLVDRLVAMTAGLALGADGLTAVGPLHLDRLADAPRYTLDQTEPLAGDTLSHWTRDRP
ncbi:bifunctional diaminohydroxyphosphoribosylaminopyrimidine deaminase/5-amino-6-(5-phosphoribosylamino)uracil reductase RibD [Rhodobacteraceae bacterium CCMM004]|nr:bifunctional diaminohydroxyphosphoribosylaminopyrimidine deaminase/5-amino-6-(5-phosphoribosylamino)uracil reductase RibD [Rhodobacteraceae bacterium CCMM004]